MLDFENLSRLFNLDNDIEELNDVSDENQNIVDKLEKFLVQARTKPNLKTFEINALDN